MIEPVTTGTAGAAVSVGLTAIFIGWFGIARVIIIQCITIA